ncbi:hypothetical protein lerEdw1_002525 [Lerista edwardsae]|nr:hypothetical protein lerEdw1_002525 [Lerista edwardsae]
MEGNFPSERRRALKSMKQCGRNIPRCKQAPENPEDISNYSLNRPAWVPVCLPQDKNTSVLESKVKALKEKKVTINKQSEAALQERMSPKKTKAHKGKPLAELASQDAVVKPQAQIRTYLTDVLLDSIDYPNLLQEEAQGAMLASLCINDLETLKGPKAVEEHTSVGWGSPEEFQRLAGRSTVNHESFLGNVAKRVSQNGLSGASSLNDLSFNQKSFDEMNGGEDSLIQVENDSFAHKNDTTRGMVTSGQLWRAESWDSLCSGGSNVSTLSLAERVERNRAMLQEMLRMPVLCSHSSQELHSIHHYKKEAPVLGNDGHSNELLANDIDWDSGVSLQDSEGYRAFVPIQELELSPRHEQAKQLLQRARMKARTNPLRASHDILPTAPQERRHAYRITAADAKNFALKDGDAHVSGNLSDSSSGESSCGQHRKRGPSPSRVRFEDESARDAEVRYLERLQQRHKRVLDSVLLSLRQGPLVSKPDLSDYINGDHRHKENGIGKACWEQQSAGQTAGVPAHKSSRGRSEKGKPLKVNEEKCSACGSYVSNVSSMTPNWNPDSGINHTGDNMHQSCNVLQERKNIGQAKETKGFNASQEDSRAKTLGPKGAPLWILPSQQRVYTERIRETYIGEVTCIDDVDSALESTTDTSDSYRTDSEDAGTNSHQSMVKSNWHSRPDLNSRPFCLSEKEIKRRMTEGERQRTNGSCRSSGMETWENGPGAGRMEVGSNANETSNSNLKGISEIRSEVTQMSANGVETFCKSNQPIDLSQLVKRGRIQGHNRVTTVQLKQPSSAVCSQQLPSHLVSGGETDSMTKKPVEISNHTHRSSNNLSQTRQVKDSSQQLTKQMTASYNVVNRVPAPPTTGKAHSSPMPYRRTVLASSYRLTSQDSEHTDQVNGPPASANSFQHKCANELEEQCVPQGLKMLSKSQLLALSTNNCNNTHAKHQPKASVTVTEESSMKQLQNNPKVKKNQGPSSSSCGVPPVTPNFISSSAISISLTAEKTNVTTSTTSVQALRREVPTAEAQKGKPVLPSTVQCKPLEIYPEPKKQQSAKKRDTTLSTSGLKKFFTTLSQSTKHRLGRFRCYSMEQICATEPGATMPTKKLPQNEAPGITSSAKMKKAPSLQSLRLVSPFCQPRKASSVQNLHSLLSKPDRSSLYLLEEPKDDEADPNRKVGAQPRRSLSVEDIGSPNLMRTVGRVVEVFPDGTSQLELQRPPQGTFGFHVSSGNGRPDTGIYVQELADASTAKLYAGLLGVGDEILEVNGAKVAVLGLAHINELLLWADALSIRVLRHRPVRL